MPKVLAIVDNSNIFISGRLSARRVLRSSGTVCAMISYQRLVVIVGSRFRAVAMASSACPAS